MRCLDVAVIEHHLRISNFSVVSRSCFLRRTRQIISASSGWLGVSEMVSTRTRIFTATATTIILEIITLSGSSRVQSSCTAIRMDVTA